MAKNTKMKTTIPFKNGEPDNRPVSALRRMPSAGTTVQANNKQNTDMLIPAQKSPFFSIVDTRSALVSNTEGSSGVSQIVLTKAWLDDFLGHKITQTTNQKSTHHHKVPVGFCSDSVSSIDNTCRFFRNP